MVQVIIRIFSVTIECASSPSRRECNTARVCTPSSSNDTDLPALLVVGKTRFSKENMASDGHRPAAGDGGS
jgi:hypothetical protein